MTYQSIYAPGLFTGSTIVVTGAGSGIGRCVAHELAHLGAHVAMFGRRHDKLERVRDEIVEDGGDVSLCSLDIRDEDSVTSAVGTVIADRGHIHGLVNNAGGQYRSPLREVSTKGFEAVVRTNLTGGFVMMREVYNQTMADRGGAIVNMIADISNGWPTFGHSAASRGGMLTLTETAAAEWAPSGVRVNSVAPGSIASSGLDTYDDEHRWFIQNEVVTGIPLQRFGTEAEVSGAIVYLLSPAASFVTGSCIRIDGGAPNARAGWWKPSPVANNVPFNGFHRARNPDILAEIDQA